MRSLLHDFGQTAQRLARNPLGIIALFIVLVYGIAGMVLGVSSGNLEPSEQKQRLDQEIRELESTPAVLDGGKVNAVEMEGTGLIRGMPSRHAWVLAEELAFRELESELGVPISRHVEVAGKFGVDGVFLTKGKLSVVEIKFTRRPKLAQIARQAVKQLGRIADRMKPASFILAIVVEGLPSERLKDELERTQQQLKSAPFQVELRVYDFDELKKKYGIDETLA